ncbi:MAG: PIN domain-containing protein [Bacteroidales bacterium]|nr:PIN domain-containing protein [Bacteroidales bacterium]MCF8454976.1 PIN domain-containing protein [Bacteroidales bacterium]
MVQAISIFVDSSLLVEYIKEKKTDLIESLIEGEYNCLINAIVYSEFLFHYIAITGKKSPLAIKENNKINETLEIFDPIKFLELFKVIEIDEQITRLSYSYMKKYNLLPNDAIILANIKIHEIKHFASFDLNDFELPCKKEEINLITSISNLPY